MTSPLGKNVSRVDGRAKVTGTAVYAADQPLEGLVHGYLLLSKIGRGSIRAMNTTAAQQTPGVLAVYTPFNPLKLYTGGGFFGAQWVPLQDTEVHHHGHIIGMVVAETFELARDAAALVRVDYDARPPTVSFTDNIPNAVPPPRGPGSGEGPELTILADGVASIDAALAASDVTVSGSFSQPIENHNAMEPHATTAVWRDERLTVYSGSQFAAGHAGSIAGGIGVDPARVHVLSPHVGGGFGNKAMTWSHSLVAAAAARALGRPVKVVLTREQTFTVTGHRSTVAQNVVLGARRDGTLVAVSHEGFSSVSIRGSSPENGPFTTSRVLYRTENLHVSQKIVRLDLPTATYMRAPGECSGSFALETAMDELAVALRMDPIELRVRNNATVVPGTDRPWSSKHLTECLQVGAERFGWRRRNPTPRSVTDGDWLVGMGTAAAIYPANQSPHETMVRVRLSADGTASVATATADLGTGMWTVLAIMGADSLSIPLHRIKPELGDSILPPSAGSFGSQSTASVAPAVRAAAAAAVTALITLAVEHERSPFHGLKPSEVRYENGDLVRNGMRISFGRLLTTTAAAGVEATQPGSGGNPAEHEFHTFGAHFCELAVNRFTGEPRLRRWATVIDAGRIVNAKTARSQIIGGTLFGIGQALYEGSAVEPTGRWANSNLADYLIPVNADIPPMDIHFLDHPDTIFNPVGVRGIGEISTVGAAAAIGNAVFNATGKRVRDLPITLDKLLD